MSMYDEVREIFEEDGADIVRSVATQIVENNQLQEDLSGQELNDVAAEAAIQRLWGYYNMYCRLTEVQPEHFSNIQPEIAEIVEENIEALVHTLDNGVGPIEERGERYPKIRHDPSNQLKTLRDDEIAATAEFDPDPYHSASIELEALPEGVDREGAFDSVDISVVGDE